MQDMPLVGPAMHSTSVHSIGAHEPPVRSMVVRPGTLAAKGSSTACIWRASSLVGDTTTAPTCRRGQALTQAGASQYYTYQARALPWSRHWRSRCTRVSAQQRNMCVEAFQEGGQPAGMKGGCTWCVFRGSSSRRIFSMRGMMKARVLPDPVQASTATSLLPANKGMVASCTGVVRSKPNDATTCRVSGEISLMSQNRLVCAILLC